MSDDRIRKQFAWLLSLALSSSFAGGTLVSPALTFGADEQVRDRTDRDRASDERNGLIPFVVEQVQQRRGSRYPGDLGKNHSRVKAAFKDVVAPANRSTLQILADNKPVVLATVVSADGFLLTKASELTGQLTCKLRDGQTVDAAMVASHQATDLALLKIEAKNLVPVVWAKDDVTADSLSIGSFLASASGGEEALAIGVVSVAARKIPAASGVLGIAVGQADTGPRVDQVMDGSSAAKAGLKVNDVITQINNRQVKTREALIATVGDFRPGDRVELKVQRGEEQLNISTTLGNRSGSNRRDFQNRLGGDLSERRGGFEQVLQHDTVLRPRDCGGPVVDLDGRVVGINIARAERVASYALPAAVVLRVLPEMKAQAIAKQTGPDKAGPDKTTPTAGARVTAAKPVGASSVEPVQVPAGK